LRYSRWATIEFIDEFIDGVAVSVAAGLPPGKLWARIEHRTIAQWTLAYAAEVYALLDGRMIVSEEFDWPHQVLRNVLVLFMRGLQLVVTLA
jgi:hypothetical protein